jgi:Holliday junction resolvase RusA-like endonuclease
MNIQSTGRIDSSNEVSRQLAEATKHVEKLSKKYNKETEISREIQEAVHVIASCNESLQDKKISPDQAMDKNMKNLLNAMTSLHFLSTDKSIQEKVNALQTGLFSAFLKELKKLEENLKSDKWKSGQKVKNVDRSKKNRY